MNCLMAAQIYGNAPVSNKRSLPERVVLLFFVCLVFSPRKKDPQRRSGGSFKKTTTLVPDYVEEYRMAAVVHEKIG